MFTVTNQAQTETYDICYFHLQYDEDNKVYHMIGLARLNLTETELVDLGVYNFYKQAIDVFARMDYQCNDLIYYKRNNKIFVMPENITDEREIKFIYG